MKIGKINRKASMAMDEATKLGFDAPAMLKLGWVLRDGKYEKMVKSLAMYEEEHNDGGVPKVGKPSVDDAISAFTDLLAEVSEDDVPTIVEAVNAGIWYRTNNAARPKSAKTVGGMRTAFLADREAGIIDDPTFMVYAMACAKGEEKGWLEKHFAK